MFWKSKNKKNSEEPEIITPSELIRLMEEHLASIKVSLLEIRCFRKKKIIKAPGFPHITQRIDIEEAWPSCRDMFHETYYLLCQVAEKVQTGSAAIPDSASFGSAIDQFVNLIDRISIALEDTGILHASPQELQVIDQSVLKIQQAANYLQKHVLVDYVFTHNT